MSCNVLLQDCSRHNEVPAEYTNTTVAVLNSSLKDHATGLNRYLDGVVTVDGLRDGTHDSWVERIDARGNTAGPQPARSYTTPKVREFYLASVPSLSIIMYSIEGHFVDIIDDDLSMPSDLIQNDNSDTPMEVSATNGEKKRLDFSKNVLAKNYGP
jgi:hypothetical protein